MKLSCITLTFAFIHTPSLSLNFSFCSLILAKTLLLSLFASVSSVVAPPKCNQCQAKFFALPPAYSHILSYFVFRYFYFDCCCWQKVYFSTFCVRLKIYLHACLCFFLMLFTVCPHESWPLCRALCQLQLIRWPKVGICMYMCRCVCLCAFAWFFS